MNCNDLKFLQVFDIHMSVHRQYNSKLQPTKCDVSWFIYSYRCSTCFRRFLRPSSGTHNCTYSFRYCQSVLLLAAIVDEMERSPISSTFTSCSAYPREGVVPAAVPSHPHLPAAVPILGKEWYRLQFHLIHDSSQQQYWSTIPEAVCTVMCSWWWVEELPETCTASVERNKSINIASSW